jgi:hypothetical protein
MAATRGPQKRLAGLSEIGLVAECCFVDSLGRVRQILESDCPIIQAFCESPSSRQFSALPPGRQDWFGQRFDGSGGDAVLVLAIAAQILADFAEPILHRHRSRSPALQPRDLRADGRVARLVLVLADQTDHLVIPLVACRETTIDTIACARNDDDEIAPLA